MKQSTALAWMTIVSLFFLVVWSGSCDLAKAQSPLERTTFRPVESSGNVIVPDHYLRRWDPVTIFFDRDTGPEQPGPEDRPEEYVTVMPAHPGAFMWLDERTLQFRPADPWPPLSMFSWTVDGETTHLTTLMTPPLRSIPESGSVGLDGIETITLAFSDPIDPDILARMITIELRELPGMGQVQSRRLNHDDFQIKAMDQMSRSTEYSYVLSLTSQIPLGLRVLVHFRLSVDDLEESFFTLSFETAEPFRVLSVGSYENRYPVAPEGSRYTPEQSLKLNPAERKVVVEFSSTPRPMGVLEGANFFHLSPHVGNLQYEVHGKMLEISGDFRCDTVYHAVLTPISLTDEKGRPLNMVADSTLYFYFPAQSSFLKWKKSQGIVERFGPQMVPLEGRGDDRVDLRIFKIDPLDRSFWTFPQYPMPVDESQRPPGPGEEPGTFNGPRSITHHELLKQLADLGSPPVSEIVKLPLQSDGSAAVFGLDLEPYLRKVSGENAPGTYLVGFRRLQDNATRNWMRIQSTDLSVTVSEEPLAVRFIVTSLATAQPVPQAKIVVEGIHRKNQWETIISGVTDSQGMFKWEPGKRDYRTIERITIQKEDDILVLDPHQAPDQFQDNQWSPSLETWLNWTLYELNYRGEQSQILTHIFTERPVYRPEEPVHIKGYVRKHIKGTLEPVVFEASVLVEASGNNVWRYPVTISPNGSFYHMFSEENLPTGEYRVVLESKEGVRYGNAAFRIEAYRLPRFEVLLTSDQHVPLDGEFTVSLVSSYYAGGRVAQRPVSWRITQFPLEWQPKQYEGFIYSSDGRFSGIRRFDAQPRMEFEGVTDDQGGAILKINPALEPSIQPRTYVVEATVTDADDQTVTSVQQIKAVPPFVLGLNVPRYLEQADTIEPEIIVVGPDGNLVDDQEVTVRLIHRQWHSHLRASDFTTGEARYITDVVDEEIRTLSLRSDSRPISASLPIDESGVYLVELESHDRLGRAQVVSVDLYAGGDEPVSWAKPVTDVFSIATDKSSYTPGESAVLVLKSPFQTAEALAIIEAPEGNQYQWLSVRGGSASLNLPILKTYMPKIPVHFVLMRQRIPGIKPDSESTRDLGKPATMAATQWVDVEPVQNRVRVELKYPDQAEPGDEVDIEIQLSTTDGDPVPGEVTLWLVDQAVLALGKEQPLDPLPDFIVSRLSYITLRDTRNMTFGYIPYSVNPGGGEGEEGGLMGRMTVRKNFQPVPYYNPAIDVGADGYAKVRVKLPDDLTNFKIRAKAISGPDRFGFGVGEIAVRLPVIVQPSLPRFVRPGDVFTALAIARIVEGEGGPGTVSLRADGVSVDEPLQREFEWSVQEPVRLEYQVSVPDPPYTEAGHLTTDSVSFTMAVERVSDGATDGFEISIPIRDDRRRVIRRSLQELTDEQPVQLPDLPEKARAGTVKRSVLISDQPGLIQMASGLRFLLEYPYGCTEQRISTARSWLAMKKFRDVLHLTGSQEKLDKTVTDCLAWIPGTITRDGLCAYWPGSKGNVSLTAWVLQFMVEARNQDYPVDEKIVDRLVQTLEQSLRSDYGRFISGEEFAERCWALIALTEAGRARPAYSAELARKAQFLEMENVAHVLRALSKSGDADSQVVENLVSELWSRVIVKLVQGQEVYGGLQHKNPQRSDLILPSETRQLAEMLRALKQSYPDDPRFQLILKTLVNLSDGNGWGSTNANAAALMALSEILRPPFPQSRSATVRVQFGQDQTDIQTGPDSPVGYLVSLNEAPGQVLAISGAGTEHPLIVRAETRYIPESPGSDVAALSKGFVVTREMFRIKSEDEPPIRIPLDTPGKKHTVQLGDILEDHVQVVNPQDRSFVAVVVPLAAGMEPLNPDLLTAPPEAKPSGKPTRSPDYTAFMDDYVAFYYDLLPKGSYDFYFRTRGMTIGTFIQPAAIGEMMYDESVFGNSNGSIIEITGGGK